MKYPSNMADAWAAFRIAAIDSATSFDDLARLNKTALVDLNQLRTVGLLDADEYEHAIDMLTLATTTIASTLKK